MDWIVTTARTVEEARTRALDLLGVDSADAEVQVMEEGKTGLFGRTKSEARVRARIKPKAPPVKDERRPSRGGGNSRGGNRGSGGGNNRDRGGNRGSGGGNNRDRGGNRGSGGGGNNRDRGGNRGGSGGGDGNNRNKGAAATAGAAAAVSSNDGGNRSSGGGGNRKPRNRGGNRNGGGGRQGGNDSRRNEDREEMPVAEQRETLEMFAKGVAAAFDTDAKISLAEEGTNLEVQVRGGEDLGRLVGNKASTLQAFEELARTAMHRAAAGRRYHRIRVDVDEYRARRREALARFATDLAEQVAASGESKAMEPMNAPDRKLVHDAVAEIAGVDTLSEGRDPRRYIVLMPASVDGDEEE